MSDLLAFFGPMLVVMVFPLLPPLIGLVVGTVVDVARRTPRNAESPVDRAKARSAARRGDWAVAD